MALPQEQPQPPHRIFDTIPFDRSSEFVAYVSDGSERVQIHNGEMRVTITDAAGQTSTHALNDNGELGDAIAGDAYYSTTVPPLTAEGTYRAKLELYWPEYQHSISTRKDIIAKSFPTLDVHLEHTKALVPASASSLAAPKSRSTASPMLFRSTCFPHIYRQTAGTAQSKSCRATS